MKVLKHARALRFAALASVGFLYTACDSDGNNPTPSTECTEQSDCRADQICEDNKCVDRTPTGDICGDGELNPGELCDTDIETPFPGSCPTDCNYPSDRCGIYEFIEDGCQTRCSRTGDITEAIDGDLCCPAGADTSTDADCAIRCGDGIVEGDEVCDEGDGVNGQIGHCNETCNAMIPGNCGDGVIDWNEDCDDSGESDECNVDCSAASCGDGIPNPTAGEACDTAGESANCNADCSAASCGDGILNTSAGEVCDEGTNNGQPNHCADDCQGITAAICGNGVKEGDEVCDEGTNNGQPNHCADDCQGTTAAICGNGVKEDDEACDEGSTHTVTCNNNCTIAACGDGIHNAAAGEACDDANASNTDGCLSTCQFASCGDGFIEAGVETCDDGANNGQPGHCNLTCTGTTAAVCGNSVVEAGEACDSGGVNTATCNSNCTAPTCGDGIHNAASGEACDDGNTNENDGCLNTCVAAVCGDGHIRTGVENCDDGALNGTPGHCNLSCSGQTAAACGNNYIDPGEDCDGGGETTTCNANCTLVSCGDGITNATAGEDCDDANNVNTDGCLNTCKLATCGDGVIHAGAEVCDDGANNGQPGKCNLTCTGTTAAVCGNSIQEAGEACDSGGVNTATCNSNCTVPTCGDGIHNAQANEVCDDGNTNNNDGCLNSCLAASCGDGFIRTGTETCDDGPLNGTPNKCNLTCTGTTAATCGNSVVEAGEECDDGNTINGDTCTNTCKAARCGDGIVHTGVEACDDGNTSNTDACLNTCVAATCGDGFVQGGVEQCDHGGTPTATCNASCQTVTPASAFRVTNVKIIDPHIFVNVPFLGCRDVTDSDVAGQLGAPGVNGMINKSIAEVVGGEHTFNIAFTASPLKTTDQATFPVTLEFPKCFANPLACMRDATKDIIDSTATYQSAGACLPAAPNDMPGRRASYTGLNNPTGNCLHTSTKTTLITVADIPITLTDARIVGKVAGNAPDRQISEGVLYGFFSKEDADAALLPSTIALVGGKPISNLLRGGGGCNGSGPASDLDTYNGTQGWWFYMNFTAKEVPYTF